MSKILVVVARRYNGHELWTALGVLNQHGHTFEVISTATRIEDEVTGQPNTIKRVINEVETSEMEGFDGVMVVSGNMQDTEAYWSNERVLSYVDAAETARKPIAAVCCSVPTIRNAARGKRVSFFPLVRSRQILKEAGAILQTVAVSVDQNLATAEHQMATQMWANAYCKLLAGETVELGLVDSGYVPRGRPRKPIPEVEAARTSIEGNNTFWMTPYVEEWLMQQKIDKALERGPVMVHQHTQSEPCNDLCGKFE